MRISSNNTEKEQLENRLFTYHVYVWFAFIIYCGLTTYINCRWSETTGNQMAYGIGPFLMLGIFFRNLLELWCRLQVWTLQRFTAVFYYKVGFSIRDDRYWRCVHSLGSIGNLRKFKITDWDNLDFWKKYYKEHCRKKRNPWQNWAHDLLTEDKNDLAVYYNLKHRQSRMNRRITTPCGDYETA